MSSIKSNSHLRFSELLKVVNSVLMTAEYCIMQLYIILDIIYYITLILYSAVYLIAVEYCKASSIGLRFLHYKLSNNICL